MTAGPTQGRFGPAFEWLGVERAWTRTRGNPSILIAIVDRGVQADHPLIGPNIQRDNAHHAAPGEDEVAGTHAAGIAAGRASDTDGFAGVAPEARILPVRFAEPGRQTLDLAHAIEYAVEAGASIIHLAHSGDAAPPAVIRAIQYAAARNVLVVSAATASLAAMRSREVEDPVPNQITVSSINERFELRGSESAGADLAAPSFARVPRWRASGHEVLHDAELGPAYVSGCAALVKAQNPGWGYHELKEHLLMSGAAAPELAGKCATGRRLDVAGAVRGPIQLANDEPLQWSALGPAELRWKLLYRSAYCANAVALYRRHGDEHWRELAYARASAEVMTIPATAMRRSSGVLRIACRESNFHSDEVALTIR